MERPARHNKEQRCKERMGRRRKHVEQGQRERLATYGKRSSPKANLEAKGKEVSTVSMEPLIVTGGRNQTSQTMKMTFIAASCKIPMTS